jgi:hypothetical protein
MGGGTGITLSATLPPVSLEGTIYEVPDTIHGLGGVVKLRCVRNDTGSAITVANDLCEMAAASAGDFGRKVDTFPCNTAGAICKPLDDAYTITSIPANDLFYVVEAGPCAVRVESSSVSLSGGNSLASDGSGRINGAVAAAGEYVVGVADAACSTASAELVVHVTDGLVAQDAG